MAIGSGLGSSIGLAPESTYGTYVAPTKFLEGTAKLGKKKSLYQGSGMAAGQTVQRGSRRAVASQRANGTLMIGVQSKQMGHLINGLMGGTVTPVQQGGTAAWLQTHPLADPFGKMYTIQTGVPDLGGTVRPYTFLGSQIISAEFACEVGGGLTANFNIEARDASEAQSLAAPSYPTINDFFFAEATVKLGTFGSEVAVSGIRSMSLRIERPKHDGGPYFGSGLLRSQGIMNDWTAISGTITADFLDKTVFADRFAADTPTSLIWEFIGPLIASTFFETFRIKVPMIFFDGDTPVADGPDVVSGAFPFVGKFDGTNVAATIEYISTDTTL